MKYARPEIEKLALAVDAIRRAENKGWFALVDAIYPVLLFATPMAYEADE